MVRTRRVVLLAVSVVWCAQSAERGAEVSFATFEAESALTVGGATPNADATIKVASSAKGYVHLDAAGERVEFAGVPAANRLVVRYSIPNGSSGTLSLYVNGSHNQDLALVSTQCYDRNSASYVRRYDELPVAVDIPAGATVSLQKDATDTCAWYAIDLVDAETAPAALSMPAGYLSIADYGAVSGDTTDDAAAIGDCIAAASAQGRGVWVPPGEFRQNTRLSVPAGVDIRGAGAWHSHIHFPIAGSTWSNDIGYALSSATTVAGIRFTGAGTARGDACILFRPVGHNDTLENLWIQNVGCISGWEGSTATHHNVVRNCRVIGLYFDGVHWGDGAAHDNLVENVFFRGMGDDAVAQVNRADQPLCYGNTARYNTVSASYWGRGLSNVGGDSLTMTDNLVLGTYNAGVIITTEVLSPSQSRPIRGFVFERNTIRQCGHAGHNHAGLHLWLNTSPMQDVVIRDNLIEYGETKGIRIDNTSYGDAGGRTLFENNISRCNAGANYDNASDDIVPVLTGNDFTGCVVSLSPGNDCGACVRHEPAAGDWPRAFIDLAGRAVPAHPHTGQRPANGLAAEPLRDEGRAYVVRRARNP